MSPALNPRPKLSERAKICGVDEELLSALMRGTFLGLEMTETVPVIAGASRVSKSRHQFSVLVGLVGNNSGTLSVNLSRHAMLFLAGRLMGEEIRQIDEDCIDAVMEIGNMVAGGVKDTLQSSVFAIGAVSLPTLVFGDSFGVHYVRGLITASAEFELTELPSNIFDDRYITTGISLLRESGA